MVKLISVKRTPGERKEFKAAFILNNGREKLVSARMKTGIII